MIYISQSTHAAAEAKALEAALSFVRDGGSPNGAIQVAAVALQIEAPTMGPLARTAAVSEIARKVREEEGPDDAG